MFRRTFWRAAVLAACASVGCPAAPQVRADDWASILVSPQDGGAAATGRAVVPSPRQLAYQEKQLGAFLHFGLPTYAKTPAEYASVFPYNPGMPDASRFNPVQLDAEQWVRTAQSFGARHLVFPAKHHDGFCLWPTKTTEYCVRNTPWKGGRGDVVRELADACKKRGMPLGLYCSPADKHYGCFSTDKRVLVGDRDAYFRFYQRQLEELLTGYGEVVMVWFDGWCDPFGHNVIDPKTGQVIGPGPYEEALVALVRRLQPGAVVFRCHSSRSDLRGVGNEDGTSPYPIWNVVRKGEGPKLQLPADAEGWHFCESDIRTRPTWAWQPNSDDKLISVDRLVKVYYGSIGHGANILINLTPDPRGLIPEVEAQRMADFGAEIGCRFGKPLAAADTGKGWTRPGVLELDLGRETRVDHVVLEEEIAKGQHVLAYAVDALCGSQWKTVAQGQSIGRKRIERFAPVSATRLRLRVLKADAIPSLRTMAAFDAKGNSK